MNRSPRRKLPRQRPRPPPRRPPRRRRPRRPLRKRRRTSRRKRPRRRKPKRRSKPQVLNQVSPAEAVFLAGEADPALLASQRARQRASRKLWLVVLLGKMRGNHVLQL